MRRGCVAAAALGMVLLASVASSAQDAGVEAGAGGAPAPSPVEPHMGPAETVSLTPDVKATVRAPRDWPGAAEQDASFAAQLKEIPGAKVVAARIWKPATPRPVEGGRSYSDAMELVCVQAPVSEWAPGMHLIVFDRMNSIARTELGKGAELDTFEPGPVEDTGTFFRQRFSAHGELEVRGAAGEKMLVEDHPDRPHAHAKAFGVHVLTVPAGSNTVIGCTLFCGELERPGQKSYACEGPIASFAPTGDLTSEPEYTLLGRFVTGVRQAPWTVGVMLLGMLMSLAGAVIALRTLIVMSRK